MWPVVQFYFSNIVHFGTVSVAIWIASSASMAQVGFMSMTTSSAPEETCLFQDRQQGTMEVLCAGVPFGSLVGF